jgi:hypothetical protein
MEDPVNQEISDLAESAYWRFDEERKRTGAERDAFKRQFAIVLTSALSGAEKAIKDFARSASTFDPFA